MPNVMWLGDVGRVRGSGGGGVLGAAAEKLLGPRCTPHPGEDPCLVLFRQKSARGSEKQQLEEKRLRRERAGLVISS